ncbi:MAG: hypothetical protein R3Y21_03165 [Mycoplasmatota bacterium]
MTIDSLNDLKSKMYEVASKLSSSCEKINKAKESNSSGLNVNGVIFKSSELTQINVGLNEKISLIYNHIIPSINRDIESLSRTEEEI